MAFKRSSVRSRSAPPPFALETPELRVASHSIFALEFRERRVSPEALAQGDCLSVIALEPPELRVASHFFIGIRRDATAFQSEGVPRKHPPKPWRRGKPWRPAFAAKAAASAE
jgi:hypothetical protein